MLNKDVRESYAWGIDVWACRNMLNALPCNLDHFHAYDFLTTTLQKALMCLGVEGWKVSKGLRFIIRTDSEMFSAQDKELARVLYDAYKTNRVSFRERFRAHSKGLGVLCNRKEGIRRNQLIIEYFGEVYTPWRWYEKQDVIKQGQSRKLLSSQLPDFYNIHFERHVGDPAGNHSLMIDPIIKGSYSSRLSHSCNPNCATIIQVVEGKYKVCMYAIRDIAFGEEMTFDYNSVTESEKEFEQAICLCGTYRCLGRYLQMQCDKKYQVIMKERHGFVD